MRLGSSSSSEPPPPPRPTPLQGCLPRSRPSISPGSRARRPLRGNLVAPTTSIQCCVSENRTLLRQRVRPLAFAIPSVLHVPATSSLFPSRLPSVSDLVAFTHRLAPLPSLCQSLGTSSLQPSSSDGVAPGLLSVFRLVTVSVRVPVPSAPVAAPSQRCHRRQQPGGMSYRRVCSSFFGQGEEQDVEFPLTAALASLMEEDGALGQERAAGQEEEQERTTNADGASQDPRLDNMMPADGDSQQKGQGNMMFADGFIGNQSAASQATKKCGTLLQYMQPKVQGFMFFVRLARSVFGPCLVLGDPEATSMPNSGQLAPRSTPCAKPRPASTRSSARLAAKASQASAAGRLCSHASIGSKRGPPATAELGEEGAGPGGQGSTTPSGPAVADPSTPAASPAAPPSALAAAEPGDQGSTPKRTSKQTGAQDTGGPEAL